MPVIRQPEQINVKGQRGNTGRTFTGYGGLTSVDLPDDAQEEFFGGEGVETTDGEERNADNNYGLNVLNLPPDKPADQINLNDTFNQIALNDAIDVFGNQIDPFDPAMGSIFPNIAPMDLMNRAAQNVTDTQYFPQRRDDNSSYTQDEIDQIVGMLNDGATTVDDVGTFYGVPPAIIQAQLDYINSQAEKEPEDTDPNQQPGAGNQGNQGTADQGVNFPGVVFPTGGYGNDASVMGPFPPGDQTPDNQPDVDDTDPNDPNVVFPQTPGTDPANTPDVDDTDPNDPDVIFPQTPGTVPPGTPGPTGPPGGGPPGGSTTPDGTSLPPSGGLPSVTDIVEPATAIAGTARALGGDMSTFFGDRTREITRQDPEYRSRGLGLFGELPINQTLTDRLNTGYTNFAGNRFAPAGTDMLNYEQRTRDNLDAIPGQALFDRSVAATEGRAPIRDIVAGSFAGSDLSPYMNPYTESVIDTTLGDIEKERQQQILRNNAIATQAGAYGGDRAALVNAQTNRAAADRKAEVAATLRARGFDQAADLYAADADRAMVGDRSNQLADVYEQRNQLSEGQDLLRAFGYGSDAYRDYLSDFGLTAGRVDDRAQRELDFLFDEHLASQGYDQDMIDNLIRLFSASPQEQEKTTETEMSTVTRIGDVLGLANQLPGAAQSAADALKKIGILED